MIPHVNSKICQAHIKVLPPSVIISKFGETMTLTFRKRSAGKRKLRQKAKIKSCAYIQLGQEALQTVHKTFATDIPVILHLLALVNSTIDTNMPPTLYIIQEGINCMPTTDYFFTSIKPAPIVVTHLAAHHNKPPAQQAVTQDPVSQQTTPCSLAKPECIPLC